MVVSFFQHYHSSQPHIHQEVSVGFVFFFERREQGAVIAIFKDCISPAFAKDATIFIDIFALLKRTWR